MRSLFFGAACAAALVVPVGCGGDPFSAASSDGGVEATGGDAQPADGAVDAIVPVPDGGLSVSGTVVDLFGRPVPNATVQVTGSKLAMSNAQGAFTAVATVVPYNVTIVTTVGNAKHGAEFLGLTRPDPTLQLIEDDVGLPIETATLTGAVPGNATLTPGSTVFFDVPSGAWAAGTNTTTLRGAPTYTDTVEWEGPSPVDGTAYLLQFNGPDGGVPTSYSGYASQAASLTAGGTTPVVFGMPVELSTTSLEPMVGLASGYSLADVAVYIGIPGASASPPLLHTRSSTAPGKLQVPQITGATFVACATQVPGGLAAGTTSEFGRACNVGLPGGSATSLAPPTTTAFTSPPSTVGYGTVLKWNPITGGVNVLAFMSSVAGAPLITVVTANGSVTVPDLTALGIPLPSNTAYEAVVYGVAPFSTIDAAAGPNGFDGIITAAVLDHGPTTSGQYASSGIVPVMTQ